MKKQNKGFTLVELLVVIGILGVLMSALFPAISSALLASDMTAMSSKGKKLVDAINVENLDRSKNGRDSLWPKRNSETEETESTDISAQKFSSSDEYFEKLFDMENRGSTKWRPYIEKGLLESLYGQGVPAPQAKKLKGCVAWSIATDVTDNLSESVPVLVSRNLEVAGLIKSGTEETSGKTEVLDMGKTFSQPFGTKAVVVIYRTGKVGSFKERYVTKSDIYDRQTVTFTEDIDYLEPSKGK